MTLSDRTPDLRARKQTPDSPTAQRITSANAADRPSLRLIPGAAQVRDHHHTPADDHAASTALGDLNEAVAGHQVVATHPPTIVEAATDIWLPSSEVRHGRVGQIAAAAAGLVQVLGLAACWAIAHVLFSTKTRAGFFALLLIASLTAYAAAHA